LVTVVDASVALYLTFDAVSRAEDYNNGSKFEESSLKQRLLPSTPHHTPLRINKKIKILDHPPALKLQPRPRHFPHKGPPFDRRSSIIFIAVDNHHDAGQ
jgi:hypothetical protein